eukprot:TRINITY_DN3050_c0_g1_i3.p1 TRINITY_DN3050_c0_g1~~TRINITY_DN3050_c0_g1_i3.p1  ORF type:complete len:185 (+),score=30.32 TRINITY_DN3050_c0_g1_i3:62-556(+)
MAGQAQKEWDMGWSAPAGQMYSTANGMLFILSLSLSLSLSLCVCVSSSLPLSPPSHRPSYIITDMAKFMAFLFRDDSPYQANSDQILDGQTIREWLKPGYISSLSLSLSLSLPPLTQHSHCSSFPAMSTTTSSLHGACHGKCFSMISAGGNIAKVGLFPATTPS